MIAHESLAFYASAGPMTAIPDTPEMGALLAGLPDDVPGIVRAVQGNLLHILLAEFCYGVELSEERKQDVRVCTAAEMLHQIHARDPRPLTEVREPAARFVGNCRDFSVVTTALLRRKGVPARARCGFATYLADRSREINYMDHWIVEVWDPMGSRWKRVDAQVDETQRRCLGIDIDPFDVPHDRFLNGGRAWQLLRSETVGAQEFGVFEFRGVGMIVGNMVRDLASLNNMELLPWDMWGMMLADDEAYESPETTAFLDRLAALTCEVPNEGLATLRELYADERVCVPAQVMSFGGEQPKTVTLADEPGFAAL
jgi:transglutaminase superfamily protein